jgi:hypothetical protein
MRTDSDIKRDVEAELKWDPDIDASHLGAGPMRDRSFEGGQLISEIRAADSTIEKPNVHADQTSFT